MLKNKVISQFIRLAANKYFIVLLFSLIGVSVFMFAKASNGLFFNIEPEQGAISGNARVLSTTEASGGKAVVFGGGDAYSLNLQKIKAQPWRNKNEDTSPYKNTPMAELDKNISVLFGPKQGYVDGYFQEEELFKDPPNGNMRTGCEFSHFAYDDPIVYPGQPEAAHLHMFFGNTDVNAYTTWDTLYNSGGGTCNGGELNRTGYWVPAMFDQSGNVRVPHFANIYYKNDNMEGNKFARIQYYPENSQLVAPGDITAKEGQSYMCINENGGDQSARVNYLDQLTCPGGVTSWGAKKYLEHNVLFQNCWNGQDASKTANYSVSSPSYFWGECPSGYPHRMPNIRYRLRYIVEPTDDTSKWYLSSDVSKVDYSRIRGGSNNHGDWWGAWNKEVNRTWVDKCNNVLGASCGFGYLDGKSLQEEPGGPALRYRKKYTNVPVKIPAQQIYNSLCSHARTLQKTEQAAHCKQ